jgi:integrase/recombinase XerC
MMTDLAPPVPPSCDLERMAYTDGTASLDLLGLILAGLKPQSRDGYLKDFNAFRRFVGKTDVEGCLLDLMRLDRGKANAVCLAWASEMAERSLSPATISRRLASLRRAVRRARQVGLTSLDLETDSPKAEAFRDCRGPGSAGWRRMLERAEAEALTRFAKPVRDLALLLLLHDRALRRGEVAALDLVDVDLEAPAVHVLGKGKAAKEWLTINERTVKSLRTWIALRGDWPGPLFVRVDQAAGEPTRLTGDSVNRMVKKVAQRAGLPRVVRAHGLRHQAITEALDKGFDVRDVKSFSRHGRIDTVMIYDDRRKDVGGEITRSIGGGKRRARRGV